MIDPIELITTHIQNIDRHAERIAFAMSNDERMTYAALMQAKSDALKALVQAEANVMSRNPMVYAINTDDQV